MARRPIWPLMMSVLLACLCANNLAGCHRCGPTSTAAWMAFAAEQPGASPGQLMERAIAAGRADVVLGIARQTAIDINAVCDPARYESTTPLMTALRACEPALVGLIAGQPGFDLARSLAPHARLRWAATCPPPVVAAFLGLPDVDVNDADGNGTTLLHEVVRSADGAKLALVLAQPGLAADPIDASGTTPLHLAAGAGTIAAVDALLARPIDVNRRLTGGLRTALMVAAAAGHDAVVARLLAHPGIDADAVDDLDDSALHIAAEAGHASVVALLVTRPGRKLNGKDHLGRTPLARAAFAGHVAVVEQLLAQPDIEVNRVDRDRQTPLWWATAAGRLEVVQRLVDHPGVKLAISNRPAREDAYAVAIAGPHPAIAALLGERLARRPATDPLAADTLDPGDDYVERVIPPRPPRTIPPGIRPRRPH